MPSTSRFAERIGKVFLPEADAIDTEQDFTPNPEGPELPPGIPGLPPELERPPLPLATDKMAANQAEVLLHQAQVGLLFDRLHADRHDGLRYTLSRNAANEPVGRTLRMSGDLFSRRLFDDIIINWPTGSSSARTDPRCGRDERWPWWRGRGYRGRNTRSTPGGSTARI